MGGGPLSLLTQGHRPEVTLLRRLWRLVRFDQSGKVSLQALIRISLPGREQFGMLLFEPTVKNQNPGGGAVLDRIRLP